VNRIQPLSFSKVVSVKLNVRSLTVDE